jgi:nitrous oxide reductase
MSDKERQKKDGRDKNKKNQATREGEKNRRKQGADAPQQAKAQSNLTDKEPCEAALLE